MRANSIMTACSIAFAAAGLATGCDKTPARPGSLSANDPDGRVRVVQSVEVVGPEIVPLGEAVQFRVMERLSDGSSRDLTEQVLYWRSDRLLKDSTSGLVTGVERGDGRVIAALAEYGSVSKDVTVLPAGTFKLVGTVTEAGLPSWPVRGALVEVTTGVGARLTAHTDYSGTYRLYGVSGEIGLRVTGDGYRSAMHAIVVSDHRTTHAIELPLAVLLPDVSGTYTLTLKAAASCGVGLGQGQLPEEARARAYQADVRQHGSRVEVTLSGDTLRRRVFLGRVEPDYVVFSLAEWDANDFYEPLIVEQLPNSRFLGIAGDVTATVSARHLGGALDGSFYILDTDAAPSSIARVGWCDSESHQFVLSR